MGYSIDSLTANCYPGTSCLINKLDIRDAEILAEYEAMVTTAKVALLEQNSLPGNFDFNHYRAIHKFLLKISMPGRDSFARLNHRNNYAGLAHEAFDINALSRVLQTYIK